MIFFFFLIRMSGESMSQNYCHIYEVMPKLVSDFDECLSSRFHDCSENAHCFNLRGTYTCSCREGFTDLSENPVYPGRSCSAELIGCEGCRYHGTCYSRGSDEQVFCECFQWYSGVNCQVNLKGISKLILPSAGRITIFVFLFSSTDRTYYAWNYSIYVVVCLCVGCLLSP